MKKIFLILIIFLCNCQTQNLVLKKPSANSSTENYSAPKYENTQKTEAKTEGKNSNFASNENNKNLKNTNQLNSTKVDNSKIEDYQLSEEEKQYLVPKVGRNFEENALVIPKSSARKIPVAVFLPFSGKNKELSQHIFNAAILSLFENDLANKIELQLFDSKDSLEENQKAFREIIQKKIKIVIGPIYTQNVLAIEKLAKDNDITVISLSNNHELLNKTTNSGGIFVGGILPEIQVDKIVNYAIDRGKFNFAIIAPGNQYGKVITDYLKKFVKARDGNFITAEYYQNTNLDIERSADKVINAFILPTNNRKRDTSFVSEYDRIYPQVILIPESGKNLSKVVATIKKLNKDEREFQFIGLSQWNDQSILGDINLLGSWFSSPQNENYSLFEKKYYNFFGAVPPRIATISYDAIYAIAKIAQSKNNTKINLNDLVNFNNEPKNGFNGIDGIFRFLPNGAVQRNLAILQVGNGSFETLEPSIDKFLKY